jgi:DNA-binding SARP family transcriptional activator
MTFEAKLLTPLPHDPDTLHGVFAEAASGGVTLIDAPAGYLLTEGLALELTRLGRQPRWLRLGPEDRDPATFLLSVIAAARRPVDEAGQATLMRMRERPGPVFGWPALFAQLARDLRACLPPDCVMVLEDVHLVSAGSPTLSLAGRYLFPVLAGCVPCVLVSHQGTQGLPTGEYTRKSADDVRLPAPVVRRLLEGWAPGLAARARDRALAIIAGRPAVLAGIHELATAASSPLELLLMRASDTDDLMLRTAEALLANDDRETRRALGLATQVEYAHPSLTTAVAGTGQLPWGPWFQRLEDGWVRVRPYWRQTLTTVLGARAMPRRDSLHQVADWLHESGAAERAIPLYLEIGDHDCAARALSGEAATLMNRGQWATVDRWLGELPDELLSSYPDLSCCLGDIAALRGAAATAQHWFDVATSGYDRRGDIEGKCRSILSGSAVAAEAGDLASASSRASTAHSLADMAHLPQVQMWAAWQLGRVALAAGDSDGALASFCRATAAIAAADKEIAARPVRFTGALAMHVLDLRRQQEAHREAQAALGRAEHEALNQLMTVITASVQRNDDMLGTTGWTGAPAPVKFPALTSPGPAARDTAPPDTQAGSLLRLRRVLLPLRDRRSADARAPGARVPPPRTPTEMPRAPEQEEVPDHAPPGNGDEPTARDSARAGPRRPPGLPDVAGSELAVHLLGPLYVALDDMAVQDWPSARCRSLFGYLLTHREPWPPREVLMEAFWPEASPEASRNSLNVAIHGLRRTLRGITEMPVVVHASGVYRLNRDLSLWLDFEEFDSRVESGRRHEDAGDVDEAMREYEFAANLYRGDFMADDPYEDWAAVTRERLRLAHLDALGRLGNLYFEADHYTACASLCQRIIERDPCREDAHRRLMRCYSRQGLPHLALMQYRLCAQALAEELGVETDPSTRDLHQRIRGHERV